MVEGVWEEDPAGILVWVLFRKEPKWYVGCWLGGFEWPIFVGVDGFAYGKTGS